MEEKRTINQNKALHLWFDMVAEKLNEVGLEQKITLGTIDVPWTKETVKMLFKKVAMAQFNKPHTSDLTSKELTQTVDTFNRYISEKGISQPFPSIEEIINQQRIYD